MTALTADFQKPTGQVPSTTDVDMLAFLNAHKPLFVPDSGTWLRWTMGARTGTPSLARTVNERPEDFFYPMLLMANLCSKSPDCGVGTRGVPKVLVESKSNIPGECLSLFFYFPFFLFFNFTFFSQRPCASRHVGRCVPL